METIIDIQDYNRGLGLRCGEVLGARNVSGGLKGFIRKFSIMGSSTAC